MSARKSIDITSPQHHEEVSARAQGRYIRLVLGSSDT